MAELVLVDTCVWAPFFNRPQLRRSSPLFDLIDKDRAVICGPILQEILIGIRRKEHAQWVASQLEGLHWLDVTRADWIQAANLGREILQFHKSPLPPSDLQIAAIALRADTAVYSTDPHFKLVPGIRIYSPAD